MRVCFLLCFGVLVMVLAIILAPKKKLESKQWKTVKKETQRIELDTEQEKVNETAKESPRSVALGFFGFVRHMVTQDDFHRFQRLLPPNTYLEIFICTPHLMKENEPEHCVDETQLRRVFGEHKVHMQTYPYDASTFIQKCDDLGYPDFNEVMQYYPFRIVSLHYGLSELSEMILGSVKKFDVHLLTRLDMLNQIDSLGDVIHSVNPFDAYVYRRSGEHHSHVEDRCMVLSPEATFRLSQLYKDLGCIDTSNLAEFYSEQMISKYLKMFPELKLHGQDGLQLQWEPYNHKYSEEFKVDMKKIIQLAREKKNKLPAP